MGYDITSKINIRSRTFVTVYFMPKVGYNSHLLYESLPIRLYRKTTLFGIPRTDIQEYKHRKSCLI